MAFAFITLKVMPESPDVNLKTLEKKIIELIQKYTQSVNPKNTQATIEPVAFGLKALILKFAVDEAKGSTDELEDQIRSIDEVTSVDVIGLSRALG